MNNTLGEAFNQSEFREVRIADKIYKINPLPIGEMYAHMSSVVKNQAIHDASLVAQHLSGNEKIQFMTAVWKDLPQGDVLEKKVSDYLGSYAGIIDCFLLAIKKLDSAVTTDFLKKYITTENLADFLISYYFLIGIDPTEEKESSEKKEVSPQS